MIESGTRSVCAVLAAAAIGLAQGPGSALAADALRDSSAVADSLASSTARPWTPPQPVAAAEPWETALRLPGRILTLPLSGLGYVTKRTLLEIEETRFLDRARVAVTPIARAGLRFLPASLGDRTGFGLGVAYSPPILRRHLIARWDGSTLEYNRTSVEVRYGPASLGYREDWRPRERFDGLGPASSPDAPSSYAAQSQSARLGLDFEKRRDREWDAPRCDLQLWLGPRSLVTRHGHDPEEPSFEQRFPDFASQLDQRVEHLVYGARLAFDQRRGKPHWAEGGRASVKFERFGDPIRALALRSAQTSFQFTRWIYDAQAGWSFDRDPRTLRLELRLVDDVPDGTSRVPLSDLATLGGLAGLSGFEAGRFHDLDSALGRLSYVFPLAYRLEMDVHAEVGQVAGDIWKDLARSSLQHSFGIALRPRLDEAVLGMIGVDWSRETVRVRFSIGGTE